MPADLRTRLKALVEEWRDRQNQRGFWETANVYPYQLYGHVADQLAAILAESEPEPEPQDNAHQLAARLGYAQQRPGFDPGTGATVYQLVKHPDCEAKAKLPLGHPHSTWVDGDGPCSAYVVGRGVCGQPRSAHEPRRGR